MGGITQLFTELQSSVENFVALLFDIDQFGINVSHAVCTIAIIGHVGTYGRSLKEIVNEINSTGLLQRYSGG